MGMRKKLRDLLESVEQATAFSESCLDVINEALRDVRTLGEKFDNFTDAGLSLNGTLTRFQKSTDFYGRLSEATESLSKKMTHLENVLVRKSLAEEEMANLAATHPNTTTGHSWRRKFDELKEQLETAKRVDNSFDAVFFRDVRAIVRESKNAGRKASVDQLAAVFKAFLDHEKDLPVHARLTQLRNLAALISELAQKDCHELG